MKYNEMVMIRTDCDTIIENLDSMIERLNAIKTGVKEIGSHTFCVNNDVESVGEDVTKIATLVDFNLEDAISEIEKVLAEI